MTTGGKPPAPGWWEDENGGWHPPAGAVGDKAMNAAGGKSGDNNAGAGCLVLIVIAAVLWLIGTLMGGGDDDDSSGGSDVSSAEDLEYGAFDVCTNFVKDRLRAPSTAEFRNYFEDDGEVVVTGGPDTYVVTSSVDSENGFGAMLRSTFVCQVEHVAGTRWMLVDLSINDGG